MSSIPHPLRFGALGLTLLLHPLAGTAAPNDVTYLSAQYDFTVKDCKGQLERGDLDGCLSALQSLNSQLGTPETDALRELKTRLQQRIGLVEARKRAGAHQAERPDLYYRTLLKAYAAVPEKYFPYDEFSPVWNQYLREETSRAKFARYRKLKFTAKAPKEDAALETAYFNAIQPRLLEYGFSVMDPSTATSSQPDVLLKVSLKGGQAEGVTNPRFQHKKVYRLALDVNTFKYLSANSRVEPVQEELEEAAGTLEEARELAIQKASERVSNLLLYHTLREMFPAGSPD